MGTVDLLAALQRSVVAAREARGEISPAITATVQAERCQACGTREHGTDDHLARLGVLTHDDWEPEDPRIAAAEYARDFPEDDNGRETW